METINPNKISGERRTALLPPSLRVIELGEAIATAICGRFLVKLGAHVTRVVIPGASGGLDELGLRIGTADDQRSAVAEWLREGKHVVEANLEDQFGRDAINELVRTADVILISGRSSDWSELGLLIEDIEAAAPRAVIGHVTTFGNSGPYSSQRGGELQLQAMGGLLNLIGVLEREPVRLAGYPAQATAGLLVLDGVMIGLFRRENSGQGARFSTSELESVTYLEWKIAGFVQAGRHKERRGEEGGGPVTVRCSDGFFALFFVPPNWEAVKKIIGDARLNDERFATFSSRAANQEALATIIEENTLHRSKKDLYYAAQALGIPAGHVATMSDLLSSPQYNARAFFEPVEISGIGRGQLPNAPWQIITADELEWRLE